MVVSVGARALPLQTMRAFCTQYKRRPHHSLPTSTMLGHALLLFAAAVPCVRAAQRASALQPLPLAKQQLGYQFYAALPIARELHEYLTEHYALLAEVDSGARHTQTSAANRREAQLSVSHALYDSIARRNFDNARAAAHDDCAERADALADPCTSSRFSPFELVCELTVVVNNECHKRRALDSARYDAALRALLNEAELPAAAAECGGDEREQRAAESVPLPPPQQAYDDFATRRTALRAAARRLSRSSQ